MSVNGTMKSHLLLTFLLLARIIQQPHEIHALSNSSSLPKVSNLLNLLSEKFTPTTAFTYIHLEGNGQLWQASHGNSNSKRVSLVVDPLASQLDFGIPWGYRANKKYLSEQATIDMICQARPSHCLLTMGLDDHTHLPTINKLRERMPLLKFIVAPSCVKKLTDVGIDASLITVLKHGEDCYLFSQEEDGRVAKIKATQGALVGPPWQSRENGILLQLFTKGKKEEELLSVYYEPHADVNLDYLQTNGIRANIMISPVTKQSLPAQFPQEGQYTLVYGGDRTLEIAEALGAEIIVPLGNGVLDIEGPLAKLVTSMGDVDDFEMLVNNRNDEEVRLKRRYAKLIKVERSIPGVALTIADKTSVSF